MRITYVELRQSQQITVCGNLTCFVQFVFDISLVRVFELPPEVSLGQLSHAYVFYDVLLFFGTWRP